jgi:hypothetical protein
LETDKDYEPLFVKDETETTDNPPVTKKTNLPASVASQLDGDTVKAIESFAEEDVDKIKIYDNARRFEKRQCPPVSKMTGSNGKRVIMSNSIETIPRTKKVH